LTTIVAVSPFEKLHIIRAKENQQEELHYLIASKLLSNAGHVSIRPCQYLFPTNCLNDALRLAATLSDLVIGTLQDVIEVFAIHGDHAITRTMAAILGEEAEQEAWY
jgi:hypothetical protein